VSSREPAARLGVVAVNHRGLPCQPRTHGRQELFPTQRRTRPAATIDVGDAAVPQRDQCSVASAAPAVSSTATQSTESTLRPATTVGTSRASCWTSAAGSCDPSPT
jgi:septal ring-binding cell division protein DamX